jgi:hypothetical protein
METLAFSLILQMVESGELQLITSIVVIYENSKNPFLERREWVNNCLTLAKYNKQVDEKIRARARGLEGQRLSSFDALHLACAESAEVDYFITCDDKLAKRYRGKMEVLNPMEFILTITTEE